MKTFAFLLFTIPAWFLVTLTLSIIFVRKLDKLDKNDKEYGNRITFSMVTSFLIILVLWGIGILTHIVY